jgi:hypothetical protein
MSRRREPTPSATVIYVTSASLNGGFLRTLLFLACFAATSVSAQTESTCPDRLDKKILNQLAGAPSVAALDATWNTLGSPNAVESLVYAERRFTLAPGQGSDDLMIAAIPRDSLTFDLLYDLCYVNQEGTNEALRQIAGGSWLNHGLEAVLRRKTGYARILMLPSVGAHNADIGEVIPCVVSELQERAPKAYKAALAALPPAARHRVCPDCC